MTDKQVSSRPRPFLVVMATIGGLALLGVIVFLFFIVTLTRSLISNTGVSLYNSGPAIGVVTIKGEILEAGDVLKELKRFEDDKDIKAIVLRIDSPGGAVGAAQEIYQEVKEVDVKKPVIASMENVAASGAYYAALGARKIVADPGTLTGSIGVIVKIPDIGPLLKKIGVSQTVLKSGALKDTGDFTRSPTPEEKKVLQGVINNVYGVFVQTVAKARHLPVDQVKKLADGRVFSGSQALALHLIDKLGNFYTAVDLAAKLAGIKGQPHLVYPQGSKLNQLKRLIEQGETTEIGHMFSRLLYLCRIPVLAFEPPQS